jgi:tRNA U38,U39,U40 pseudouridine synthase TruA
MTKEEFVNKQLEKSKENYRLSPPPTTSDEALNALTTHFLGENWYTTFTLSKEQVNTEIVARILDVTQPKSWLQKLFNL